MQKHSFKVQVKNNQICREYQCEYQQLKKMVAQQEIQIPFDCLLLIDQNNKVYSATQLPISNSLFFWAYDIREIFIENQFLREELLQLQKSIRYQQEIDQKNLEIQTLKGKLYDQNECIQKQNKKISQLEIELQTQKDLLIQNTDQQNVQIQKFNEEKQKNEHLLKLLLDEKVFQLQSIIQEKDDQKIKHENDIQEERQSKILIQQEFIQLKIQKEEEFKSFQAKQEQLIKQLQEELTKKQNEIEKKELEIRDFQFAHQEYIKSNSKDFLTELQQSVLSFENQKFLYDNIQLKQENQNLKSKIKDLENNNSNISQH